MTLPDQSAVMRTLYETWPPERSFREAGCLIRQGGGGGKRVSAATALDAIADLDIAKAEKAMAALGQDPLFVLTPDAKRFDAALADRGYKIADPTVLMAMPSTAG
ncbi:MAG: GNAT family N-acetyltransferase, partial [Pseudomonadota bacterium]